MDLLKEENDMLFLGQVTNTIFVVGGCTVNKLFLFHVGIRLVIEV